MPKQELRKTLLNLNAEIFRRLKIKSEETGAPVSWLVNSILAKEFEIEKKSPNKARS